MTRQEKIAAYESAKAKAHAARVPDADRDGPGREPVTVSGYYSVPTVSGRPAWVYYAWTNGRCNEVRCTYDLAAERAFAEAAANDPRISDDNTASGSALHRVLV